MKLSITLVVINLTVLFIVGVIVYKDTTIDNIRK